MSPFTGISLVEGLQRSVRLWGNKTALIFKDREWSYRDIDLAARKVGNELRRLGFEKGDRLAAYGKNSDAYIITFLACAYTGVIHVPVNFNLKGGELAYILNQSGSRGIICDEVLIENIEAVRDECTTLINVGVFSMEDSDNGSELNVLGLVSGSAPAKFHPFRHEMQDCLQIMYTSGTTSLPKGAVMTNMSLMAQYIGAIIHLDIKQVDTHLAALPLYHTAQMHVFTIPLMLVGGCTVLIDSPSPQACLSLIEKHCVTGFFSPPTVWIGLLEDDAIFEYNLSSLKKLYYGAAAMPEAIVQRLLECLPSAGLYNCYGQTEMSPLATVLLPEEHKERPSSAGRPIFFVETRIVDDDMNDVPAGENGEIVHRSPQIMQKYWDKPDETDEAFANGWFHSGDIGKFDNEGYLYIVDRIKDVINTGGVLVASREVEEALYRHEAISEVAVVSMPDKKWIEAVTAVVILKESCSVDESALIEYAKRNLAPYKVPKKIVFMKNLPKNPSGKVLKRELRDMLVIS